MFLPYYLVNPSLLKNPNNPSGDRIFFFLTNKTNVLNFIYLTLYFGIKLLAIQETFPWIRKTLGISQIVMCLLGMQKLISETT